MATVITTKSYCISTSPSRGASNRGVPYLSFYHNRVHGERDYEEVV